jgi:hypothetical protein
VFLENPVYFFTPHHSKLPRRPFQKLGLPLFKASYRAFARARPKAKTSPLSFNLVTAPKKPVIWRRNPAFCPKKPEIPFILLDNTNNENLSDSRGQDAYGKTSYGILRWRDAEGGS